MREILLQAIKDCLKGSHEIKIVFKQEEHLFLSALMGMEHTKLVSLPAQKIVEYMGVRTLPAEEWNRYWADKNNRMITIKFSEVFITNCASYIWWVRDKLYKSVESVEVVE